MTTRGRNSTAPIKKKRPHSKLLCSYCRQPAAVTMENDGDTLCLIHYYSTPAVRKRTASVNDARVKRQQPAMQDVFERSFLELQQKLQAASDLLTRRRTDPLADLHSGGGGGFIQHARLPTRFIETQKEQAAKQRKLEMRMKRAAVASEKKPPAKGSTARRQHSKKTVWHSIMDDGPSKKKLKGSPKDSSSTHPVVEAEIVSDITCVSCGKQRAILVGSSASRNSDMAKGETWGSKDRDDDVISRYICQECGRTWNEES